MYTRQRLTIWVKSEGNTIPYFEKHCRTGKNLLLQCFYTEDVDLKQEGESKTCLMLNYQIKRIQI